MDTDVRREMMRSRARLACGKAAEERGRAEELIQRAVVLGHGRRWLSELHRQGTSRRLVLETEMADDGVMAWGAIGEFVEFDSRVVGRDVVIERAKTVLCDRYRIGRGDAFAILRRTSSRQNRKLREVARTVVTGPPRP